MSYKPFKNRGILIIGNLCIILLVVVYFSFTANSQNNPNTDKWESYRFLLGEWVGEGSGQPGQGEGGSTFTLDLKDNILVRKSYNNIPATEDRPAVEHEDMMVIYHDPGMAAHAMYWDNEGHSIAYGVRSSSNGDSLIFLSQGSQQTPGFRLTYEKLATDSLKVSFEFAPPGKPDAFSLYTSGIIYRK